MKRRELTWVTGVSLSAVLSLVLVAGQQAQAQTYTVLHNFTGGVDGATPYTGLSADAHGNLYGTTFAGGDGYGTVSELSRKGPRVAFNPTSLGFGWVPVGRQETLTTTLTNTGYATLHITNITITGSRYFSQTNNCPTGLGAGHSCVIDVTFHPGKGQFTADLSITDDAPGSPQQVPLSGSGRFLCNFGVCGGGCSIRGCTCLFFQLHNVCVFPRSLKESLLDGNPAASSSCGDAGPLLQSPTR